MKSTSIRRALLPGIALLALALSACGGADAGASTGDGSAQSGKVAVDGSSTVFPMSDAAAELLLEESPDVKVTVGESGTGGGFEAFCAGKTDISDASRPIKDEEAAVCKQAGIDYTELQVATDALTMVVHRDLDVDCLTVDQIVRLWGPGSQVRNWNELDPDFPDQKIALFGPGTDSGTYDYLAADVIGDESESTRSDYESSEDDNVLVQGVGGTEGATGYFGYTYYEENTDSLKALAIDNGEGCVEPSAETAQDGSYAPLARPLFIYVNNAEYDDNEAVAAYVDFYIENLSQIAEVGKFIPLSDDAYAETRSALEGIAG
ncbi:PstS family phosphate ABC transporter substrate-binding protein [Nocardioides sp. cx-173]|uniref:PstS family phosphate ABC transporter substrate-binding protein n=1 Tax=Nocardioides sp. cx-173 TaxID=2898796 RepID=UPI001E554FF0|nr:PstS family phosphate ABC transporter substrate-binding protein [Nocardioides sp. cx-173]MCD4526902.1 PstS family phosphate ABC transporter substrate-binding protein [Nocardioides sp. cx-173]UGB41309.1 PstS family phosphate ABC transporter substrate-binding protein [Nocardioides sp. cx-173]